MRKRSTGQRKTRKQKQPCASVHKVKPGRWFFIPVLRNPSPRVPTTSDMVARQDEAVPRPATQLLKVTEKAGAQRDTTRP